MCQRWSGLASQLALKIEGEESGRKYSEGVFFARKRGREVSQKKNFWGKMNGREFSFFLAQPRGALEGRKVCCITLLNFLLLLPERKSGALGYGGVPPPPPHRSFSPEGYKIRFFVRTREMEVSWPIENGEEEREVYGAWAVSLALLLLHRPPAATF